MFDIFKQYITSKVSITDEALEQIRAVSIEKKLRKKQYLLQEGDVWRYHVFICKGCLRSYCIDDKGTERINHFAVENWWTGDRESLLNNTPSKQNIDALEDTEIILITKENFDTLCRQIPPFNELIQGILNRSFILSQNRIQGFISLTAEERYLRLLDQHPQLTLRVPQQMIASYLGITPETLSRIRRQIDKK